MKSSKILLAITIVFFMIVNTSYFWEMYLPPGGNVVLFMFLFFFSIFWVIVLLFQLVDGIREKFKDRRRIWVIGIMSLALGLIAFRPGGLINFEQFEEEALFFASREGVANCKTAFKLLPENQFKEREVCFGVSVIRGQYEYRNDTLFFQKIAAPKTVKDFYEFAVIQEAEYSDNKVLRFYKNHQDTIGYELWISKNELLN